MFGRNCAMRVAILGSVTAMALIVVAPLAADATNQSSGPRVIVPAETTIPLRLLNTINSRTAYAGQRFYARTIYPITAGNRIVIPVGTYVKGTVLQVKRKGLIHGAALIRLRCDSMTFPNGVTVRLATALSGAGGKESAKFNRKDEPAIQGQGPHIKPRDVGTIAATADSGILVGAIATGTAKGALLGGLAGGLAGLAAVLVTSRKSIILPPGTDLQFQLVRPLVLNWSQIDPAAHPSSAEPAIPPYRPGQTG